MPPGQLVSVKLVGVLALERSVERLDGQHVRFDVASWLKHRSQAADLAGIVHVGHHDGHLGTQCDVVKAGFPVTRFVACTLRRNDQLQRALRFKMACTDAVTRLLVDSRRTGMPPSHIMMLRNGGLKSDSLPIQ